MARKYFGTDGIRGAVGTYPITAEFMLRLGWAAGRVLGRGGRGRVLIGKDTRISGYMFESALEAGLSAAGVDILLLGPMPTPAIAYLTRTLHASAGIVISASHNPHYDNGVKFFSADGTKLPDDVEMAIEVELEREMVTVPSAELGKAKRVDDAAGRYIEFCKSTIGPGVGLQGLKVVVDCANGATYDVAPNVFDELGADVSTIGASPDGLNINDGCGSTRPDRICEAVLERRADLGIALDGDGDRVIMVDHAGDVVDGDELLYIIASHRHRVQTLGAGVVGTVMSNLGLEHALGNLGIPFQRTAVGDRYVIDYMRREGWLLGGESSGHIICLDRTTTGDGVVSALQVLAAMMATGKSLQQLKSGMRKYPQTMINVRLAQAGGLLDAAPIRDAVSAAERTLGQRGRVLLRPSGTEPLIRVMVEGEDADEVRRLAEQLAGVVESTAAKPSQTAVRN
ncbi:MAG: phosphoglucosamine mutase [Gammaproteobacteria bacterium]